MKLLILNGPNLNLLGKREPEIYGRQSFEDYFEKLQMKFPDITIHYYQSNHEGKLIDQLHEAGFTYNGIIFNPGAYTHTSIALADAIAAIETPVVEVHISNTLSRESFRHHSYTAANCVGSIIGLGLEGYDLAVAYFMS